MADGDALGPGNASTQLDTGLTQRLSSALVKLHKAGGFLLVFIFVGLILLGYLAIGQATGAKMYVILALGSASLILPMIVVWLGFMRPVMELRRRLEDKSEFIANVRSAVLQLTSTVRSLSDEVIQHHDRIAGYIKVVGPHLEAYPALYRWIEGTQNLSGDLISDSLLLRDAAKDMEGAVLSADASKLKDAVAKLSEIATRINISSKAASVKVASVKGEIREKQAQVITAIQDSPSMKTLDSALSLALKILNPEDSISEKDNFLEKVLALRRGLQKTPLWGVVAEALKATESPNKQFSALDGKGEEREELGEMRQSHGKGQDRP